MADAAPRSFVATLAGLLTGIAALISAGVAAYNLYKRERPPAPDPEAVEVSSFEAQPLQIAPGEALVLRWRTEHARTCSLEPEVGAVGANGTRTVKPAADTTYTLRCHGATGEDERSVSVSVVARTEIAREEPPPEPLVEETSRGERSPPTAATTRGADDGSADEWEGDVVEQLRRLEDMRRNSRQPVDRFETQQGTYDSGGAVAAPPQGLAFHCCDMYGNQRCVLVSPVLVGSGCFCPYQGTGISCP